MGNAIRQTAGHAQRPLKPMVVRMAIVCITTFVFLMPPFWRSQIFGDEIVFADDFETGLSDRWNVSGIRREDYRIRKGGLEMRVQPGKLTDTTPMLTVALPANGNETVIASVELIVPDGFTEPCEMAGLFLTGNGRPEFGAKKQYMDGHLLFSPGKPEFIGKPGEEGHPAKYSLRFWPAESEAGPLRIVVRNNYADFQVGPSTRGDYLTFFHSAIEKNPKERGFALVAAGGSVREPHWVRFDNFRVWRVK